VKRRLAVLVFGVYLGSSFGERRADLYVTVSRGDVKESAFSFVRSVDKIGFAGESLPNGAGISFFRGVEYRLSCEGERGIRAFGLLVTRTAA
jgi:hypothetical protein